MLKIRFKRGGRSKCPVFFMVAIESARHRDSGLAEKLCTFHRMVGYEKGVYMTEAQKERTRYLLSCGAQLTESCFKFLKKAKLDSLVPQKMATKMTKVYPVVAKEEKIEA